MGSSGQCGHSARYSISCGSFCILTRYMFSRKRFMDELYPGWYSIFKKAPLRPRSLRSRGMLQSHSSSAPFCVRISVKWGVLGGTGGNELWRRSGKAGKVSKAVGGGGGVGTRGWGEVRGDLPENGRALADA